MNLTHSCAGPPDPQEGRVHRSHPLRGRGRLHQLLGHRWQSRLRNLPPIPRRKTKDEAPMVGPFRILEHPPDDVDCDKSMKVIATNVVAAVIIAPRTSTLLNNNSCDSAFQSAQTTKI